MPARDLIFKSYSAWTSLSALRMGAPMRSKKEIYPLIAGIDFRPILDRSRGNIDRKEFESWHKMALNAATNATPKMANQYGWAAKIINIYLKTYCYIGDGGRAGIRECLHPPIDTGLWSGVKRKFKSDISIISDTHSTTSITGIDSHEKYLRVIRGLRNASYELDCNLIEIEQLWEGGSNA